MSDKTEIRPSVENTVIRTSNEATTLKPSEQTVIKDENSSVIPLSAINIPGITVKNVLETSSGEANLFRALDGNNKECILKIYRRKNAIKSDVIEKLLKIHHPNVAEILGNGTILVFPYVILPWYSNGSLKERLSKGEKYSPEELREYIIPEISSALRTLHRNGILHRDIKPSNVMLKDDGKNVVLIDFGISSFKDDRTVVSSTEGISRFYAAPEAVNGLWLEETDWYAFGITIYELLTGYTPFQNIEIKDVEKYALISKIPFPNDFPGDIKNLILGLTWKDISERHNLNNPNRRWGFTEVTSWLNGENPKLPGSNNFEINSEDEDFKPYTRQ